MNNKGYSLVEVLISISISVFVIGIILNIESDVASLAKNVEVHKDYCDSFSSLTTSIYKDLEKSWGNAELSGNILSVGNVKYEFNGDGVRRITDDANLKITNEYFKISSGIGMIDMEMDNVKFSIPIRSTSFSLGV